MSNLLNNSGKKKLLNRGNAIVPEQQFDIGAIKEVEQTKETESKKSKIEKKKNEPANTSLRVTKQTRNRLKALIQYGKAENVDLLIDILLDEYIENNFTKEDKKTYELVLKLIQDREK